MKVSVLIAATGPAGLEETLACLGAQTHPEWELIAASPGEASALGPAYAAFVAATPHPVFHRALPADATVTRARNELLGLATGDPVAFLEPGDTWLPSHLALALREIAAGADVAVSDLLTTPSIPTASPHHFSPPATLVANPVRTLFTREAIAGISAAVFRREAATRVGGFDERFNAAAPRDFWFRCALHHLRFAATHHATCLPGPATPERGLSPLLSAEETVLFFEKHRDAAAIPSVLRRRLLAASLVAQGKLLQNVDRSHAARCFWRAWSLQPVHVQTLGQFALTGWRSTPAPAATPPPPAPGSAGNP